MSRSLVKGRVIGAVVATSGGAVAGYNRIGDQEVQVRMERDPRSQIPLVDGHIAAN